MSELWNKTAAELGALLEKGTVTSRELVGALLARVDLVEPVVHAFNSLDRDYVLKQAEASDQRRTSGESRGPLDGVPVALKDVIAEQGMPLTASSRMLENFISPYDAHVTENLRGAGAILFGRCNLDEFAMGSSTENSAFGPTRNPWDPGRVPGGSSGGSAAAVAGGLVPLSLGSDTGGSIRQPAAFCGVVGMKPSYGLVSRYGLIAFASSLDQIGPFAHTVEDAALLLGALVGHDRRDSTSVTGEGLDYRAAIERDPDTRPVLGVPKEYFGDGLDPEVRSLVGRALDWYAGQGCELVEISLPTTDWAVPVYYIIAPAEASSNLSRYDGVRYGYRSQQANDGIDLYFQTRAQGFGAEVKRRIILGTYALSSGYYDAYYLKAQQVRGLIRDDFARAFERCDALLTPTTPTPAFAFGEKVDDPLAMYLNDIFTINVNLAGLPALNLPCGFTAQGLPVGLQIIGQPFKESHLLRIAHQYDRVHQWGRKVPEVVQP